MMRINFVGYHKVLILRTKMPIFMNLALMSCHHMSLNLSGIMTSCEVGVLLFWSLHANIHLFSVGSKVGSYVTVDHCYILCNCHPLGYTSFDEKKKKKKSNLPHRFFTDYPKLAFWGAENNHRWIKKFPNFYFSNVNVFMLSYMTQNSPSGKCFFFFSNFSKNKMRQAKNLLFGCHFEMIFFFFCLNTIVLVYKYIVYTAKLLFHQSTY